MVDTTEIKTERLLLRQWKAEDLTPFAELNQDPSVMEYFPSILTREESDALAKKCKDLIQENGWARWAVSCPEVSDFIGFVGLLEAAFDAPFTPAVEIGWLPMLQDWKGLCSIMMIKSERAENGKTQNDTRFYICSLPYDTPELQRASREHWAIENTCHWVLDVNYQEDKSRIRKGYGAENLSRLKRLTLNLLMQDKTNKQSIATKRFEAALDDLYREQLLRSAA